MDDVSWFGRRERVAATQAASAPPRGGPDKPQAALTIDALGRKCPIPIIMLAEQIRDVPVGAIIALLADDPAAYADVPSWCRLKSHELAGRHDHATGWAFLIRRSY
jgi:tRNA 2-thiouridine synthesizing protein A